jgi:hypothetical protein
MHFRLRLQLAEALGPVNRWYCSQAHGRPISDPELLIRYFVKSGGAWNFAMRYEQAMSPLNRWYCSEFYRRDIRDPQILWDYYTKFGASEINPNAARKEMSVAS